MRIHLNINQKNQKMKNFNANLFSSFCLLFVLISPFRLILFDSGNWIYSIDYSYGRFRGLNWLFCILSWKAALFKYYQYVFNPSNSSRFHNLIKTRKLSYQNISFFLSWVIWTVSNIKRTWVIPILIILLKIGTFQHQMFVLNWFRNSILNNCTNVRLIRLHFDSFYSRLME